MSATSHRLVGAALLLMLSACASGYVDAGPVSHLQRIERFKACPAISSLGATWPAGLTVPGQLDIANPVWVMRPEKVPDEVLADPGAWAPVASARGRHLTLRERAGAPMPSGRRQILLFTNSDHYTSVEESLVATQGGDGIWWVDFVSQINVDSDGPHETTIWRRSLPPDANHALETLLADPCLSVEPTNTTWTAASIQLVPAPRWTMEFKGVADDLRIAGAESGFGRAGQILDLLR